MAKLEDLKQGAQVKGIDPSGPVGVINVKWFGSEVVKLTYRDQKGQPHTELLYRDREADLEVIDTVHSGVRRQPQARFKRASCSPANVG